GFGYNFTRAAACSLMEVQLLTVTVTASVAWQPLISVPVTVKMNGFVVNAVSVKLAEVSPLLHLYDCAPEALNSICSSRHMSGRELLAVTVGAGCTSTCSVLDARHCCPPRFSAACTE